MAERITDEAGLAPSVERIGPDELSVRALEALARLVEAGVAPKAVERGVEGLVNPPMLLNPSDSNG